MPPPRKKPGLICKPGDIYTEDLERQPHAKLDIARRSGGARFCIVAATQHALCAAVGVIGNVRRGGTEAEVGVIEGIHHVAAELQSYVLAAQAELFAQRKVPFIQTRAAYGARAAVAQACARRKSERSRVEPLSCIGIGNLNWSA